MADIIHFGKDIVKRNGYEERVEVIHGNVEDMKQKIQKHSVDVIISAWMGHFLLFENMLESIIEARDYFLKEKTGTIWPNKASQYVAAIADQKFY